MKLATKAQMVRELTGYDVAVVAMQENRAEKGQCPMCGNPSVVGRADHRCVLHAQKADLPLSLKAGKGGTFVRIHENRYLSGQ